MRHLDESYVDSFSTTAYLMLLQMHEPYRTLLPTLREGDRHPSHEPYRSNDNKLAAKVLLATGYLLINTRFFKDGLLVTNHASLFLSTARYHNSNRKRECTNRYLFSLTKLSPKVWYSLLYTNVNSHPFDTARYICHDKLLMFPDWFPQVKMTCVKTAG